jgi:hypothetical protein
MPKQHIFREITDPVDAPEETGHHWINTATKKTFISVGIDTVADWQPLASEDVAAEWGLVTGDIADQTDLNSALNGKAASVHTHVKSDITDFDDADYATAAQGSLATSAVQPGDLSAVATSGDYDDLSNKPTIPGGAWGDITGTLADQTDLQTELNGKQAEITGSNNKLVFKNSSGDVVSLDSHTIAASGAVGVFNPFAIISSENTLAKSTTYNTSASEASPNSFFQGEYTQINVDTENAGFDLGTNGNAIIGSGINVVHQGLSDIGGISLLSQTVDVGNGTDPIDVNGIGYVFGFGQVNAGVTLSGPIQGYGFQPVVNAAATINDTEYVQSFYDSAQINTPVPFYTSFNSSPTLDEVQNNKNFTGVNIFPTINTFDGNAGFQGVSVGGNLGTFNDNGYYHGLNVNPNITSSRYAAGVNVSMDNVTPFAGVSSSLTEQDLTFVFNQPESNTNSYTLEYTPGATAGAEVVGLALNAITVQIEDGVSTAAQIKAAMEAIPQFASAITITVSGAGSNAQDIFGPTNFTGGENPGQVLAAYLDGNVDITGSLSFGGALSIGKLNAFATESVVAGSGNPASIHNLISNPTVGDNETIALGDTIGVNTAMLLTVGTNSSVTSALVGLSALALPAVVNMGAGSTVDRVAGATFAISLDMGASGTIDNLDLCRAVGLPNGTTTVTRLKGYAMDLPFGDPGTTTWGFYESPGVNNYLAGNLLIGGTAGSDDTVTNSSVALEIKSTAKAFLNARMTTTERDAMTAVNGMQIYNTTTDKLQVYAAGSWVDLH